MPDARPAIGLDLGGTKILALVVASDGAVLGRALRPTPQAGAAALLEGLAGAARDAAAAAGIAVRDACGVGLGAPGPTDPEAGVLLEPPNLPADCHDLPLGALLPPLLGAPVRVENDANAAALGEHRFGAGRGQSDMVYVTISTGIGGGIIVEGRLVRGAGLIAGEIGHMLVAPEGADLCGCGRTGCWEAICSGTGLARQARAAAAAGEAPALLALAGGDVARITPSLLLQATGDPAVAAIATRAVLYNGVGLRNLLHLLSPGLIVIGGGLTHAWDRLIAPAADWALGTAMHRAATACRIVPAQLGELVGGLGAAALWTGGSEG